MFNHLLFHCECTPCVVIRCSSILSELQSPRPSCRMTVFLVITRLAFFFRVSNWKSMILFRTPQPNIISTLAFYWIWCTFFIRFRSLWTVDFNFSMNWVCGTWPRKANSLVEEKFFRAFSVPMPSRIETFGEEDTIMSCTSRSEGYGQEDGEESGRLSWVWP